jgi:hypothetical protein
MWKTVELIRCMVHILKGDLKFSMNSDIRKSAIEKFNYDEWGRNIEQVQR